MTYPFASKLVLGLVLASAHLCSQTFDPIQKATGWARADKDGSFVFYDSGARKLRAWMRDGGVFAEADLAGLWQVPEKWVMDASFNTWVVSGRTLMRIGQDGKATNLQLPHKVGDLTWDAQGFYLSYQCAAPYVEKRNYATGQVLWSYQPAGAKEEEAGAVRNRILVTQNKTVVISRPDSLNLDLVDGLTGKPKGEVAFTYKDGNPPALAAGGQDRGTIAWWLDHNTAFQAVAAAQVPSLGMVGLVLAKEDLTYSSVEFIPTGLSERHAFVGMVDSDAVFIAPGGGLVYFPVR